MQRLPIELIGEIANSLDTKSAVALGKCNRHFSSTLSRQDFGFYVTTYVAIEHVLDSRSNYNRKSHVIGYFTSFLVKTHLELTILPVNTKAILFSDEFEFEKKKFPQFPHLSRLTKINLGHRFNLDAKELKLPDSLTHLTFGTLFNQPVEKLELPPLLTHLEFGFGFDQSVNKLKLPETLQSLTFGFRFRQSVNQLKFPPSLRRLQFGYRFNQYIGKINFPNSLTHLYLGHDFDKSYHLNFSSLCSLTHLEFENYWYRPIRNLKLLLPSLVHCTMGGYYGVPINIL